MQEREVITKVATGEVTLATLIRQEQPIGWIIHLHGPQRGAIPLENKRGRSIRLFKTSDAAIRWCGRMGFTQATVQFSDEITNL